MKISLIMKEEWEDRQEKLSYNKINHRKLSFQKIKGRFSLTWVQFDYKKMKTNDRCKSYLKR